MYVFGRIHPRDKLTVGFRLALSGLTIAYGVPGLKYQGPRESAFFVDTDFYTLKIKYDGGKDPITVRSNQGFEVSFIIEKKSVSIMMKHWLCGIKLIFKDKL